MAYQNESELALKQVFEPFSCRHYVNNTLTVIHCHHYAILYTQLAMDCGFIDAKQLLASAMEESVYPFLIDYFESNNLEDIAGRIAVGERYYADMGLGCMEVKFMGEFSGEVVLTHSHVDEGWLHKWGKSDRPVNYMTAGYVSALFSAVMDREIGAFTAVEASSIVCGAPVSRFKVSAMKRGGVA